MNNDALPLTRQQTKEKVWESIRNQADYAESKWHHSGIVKEALTEENIHVSRALIMVSINDMYPVDLSAMLEMDELRMYISDKTGNDLFINDPERAKRIHEAAEHGANGSTHAETIEDWRDYLSIADYPDWLKDCLTKEIDETELWHELQGSLDHVP